MISNKNGNGNGNRSHALNGSGRDILASTNGNGSKAYSQNGNGPSFSRNGSNGNGAHKQQLPVGQMTESQLMTSPLVPDGYFVPKSRNVHPSKRMRQLLETESYLFGPGCYDP